MNSLWTVVKFEFVRTINKPSFWVRTLAVPVLIGAVIGLSIFSSSVANQADEKAKESSFSIAVMDASGILRSDVLKQAGAVMETDRAASIERVKAGKLDAFFYYPAELSKTPVEIYAREDGLMKNGKYEEAASALLKASLAQAIGGSERATLLDRGPTIQLTTYENGQQTKGFGRVIVPGLFLVLFYIIIVLLGNQMLTSTTEEKENRVIEMILTSVTAKNLIIGKILALVALGVIQILAILVPVAIAYIWFRSQLNIPQIDLNSLSFAAGPIAVGAIIFTGGFLLFTALLVAIGAAVPTAKEAGAFFGFTMILVFVPFYALAAIVSDPGQPVVQAMTYFPLTSPITLMLRNAVGNLSLVEAGLSVVLLYVSGIALMMMAVRIFRFGSLEYARKLKLKEVLARRS